MRLGVILKGIPCLPAGRLDFARNDNGNNMPKTKRKWDLLTDDERRYFIDQTITFFEQKQDQKIGIIAAEEILDFFLENISEIAYNKGILDSKETLKKRFDDLEIDLEMLLNK